MQLKTKALVLSALKYQEKSLIVKCFTQEKGLQSFFVRNAFAKGKGAQKIAYFQPLTLLEIEVQFKGKGGLEYFKEVKLAYPYQTITYDFSKNSIAIFVAEILQNAIKEEEANEGFFSFLEAALQWLDTHNEVANFHLILLVEMTKYLGFYPDISQIEKPFFNSLAGGFTEKYEMGCLELQQSFLLKRLLQHSFTKEQRIFSGKERQELLDLLMRYYQYHLADFREPNSLDVLKEVFAV